MWARMTKATRSGRQRLGVRTRTAGTEGSKGQYTVSYTPFVGGCIWRTACMPVRSPANPRKDKNEYNDDRDAGGFAGGPPRPHNRSNEGAAPIGKKRYEICADERTSRKREQGGELRSNPSQESAIAGLVTA
ncbi:hypothetical protein GN958_ATG00025 [Phytophthora infestans]|uniref:Uncharacterized protein n=1 Tax=Phytophthora infestans TaxID=4787 RepID=A0A8S9VGY2_PHYIN|nr:hypothetical protein GN958_ATG00025 [Phytophthora infestans]